MPVFINAIIRHIIPQPIYVFISSFNRSWKLLLPLSTRLRSKLLCLFSLIVLINLFCKPLQAQEYNYINYNIKDGLPSNTIYSICQDKDGFIWFATDAGAVRYNGVQFKNYTSADGLPDNEILRLYADKKGRVWIVPFKDKLCFYKNGKIHNEKNDSLLKQIPLSSFVVEIIEDNLGNLLIYDNIHVYTISDKDSVNLLPISNIRYARKNLYHPGFVIAKKDTVFNYDYKTITIKEMDTTYQSVFKRSWLDVDSSDNAILFPQPPGAIEFTREHMRLRFISTIHGSLQIAKNKPVFEEHYLPDEKVSATFQDDEKNIWFAVPGKGLMKLASAVIHNYTPSKTEVHREFYAVSAYKGKIVTGSDDSRLYLFSPQDKSFTPVKLEKFGGRAKYNNGLSRAFCAKLLSTGDCIVGFDDFLAKLSVTGKIIIKNIFPVKAVAETGSDELIVATGKCLLRIRKNDLTILDTLYHQRATAVCYLNNTLYFGTLSGLYKIDENKKISFLGNDQPKLSTRISAITSGIDNILWVATYNEGLTGVVNDKIVYQINTLNHLPSNNCRSLYSDNQFLWVGTNKGICRISIDSSIVNAISYQQSQGLTVDMINSIYVDDSMVYAGTPAGLTVFRKNLSLQQPKQRLKLLGVTIGDSTQSSETQHYLGGYGKRIRIDYSLISFRSNNIPGYVYRIEGISQKWDTTTNPSIEYSYLPPGDFVLEIKAITDNREIAPNPIKLFFTISTPFWKTKWFLVMAGAFVFALGWLVIYMQLKKKSQHEKRKKDIQLEMLELQQKALRAQMNPHFIFNCLNTVQDFILSQDIEPANRFLVNLSSLIRQTLENSSNSFISIADEVRYLTTYLELEKTRFDNRFNFSFVIEEKLQPKIELLKIPTMIVQPYIENAIKHGISNVRNNAGEIIIEAALTSGNTLTFVIKDNGIGINQAKKGTPGRHHSSKGMALTEERVRTITQITGKKIWVNVKDVQEEDITAGSGTRVEIIFEL